MQCLSDDTVLDWIEGRLSGPALAAAEAHLEECEPCQALVAQAAATPGERAALLAPGTELGRYRVLSVRGAGAMGVVYAADDRELGRKVALKVLRTDGMRQAEVEERLLSQEALTLAKLSHPNVVTIYDVALLDGKLAIAMELVEGQTMRDWLDERTRSPGEVLALLRQAGAGLAAAHAVDVVHGDFKPDNVLIGSDGRARVGDFGLSRGETVGHQTTAGPPELLVGRVAGTPTYMAPEQLAGQPLDARADVFAFCVVAWEAYFGARPFAGKTTSELAAAISAGPPRPRTLPLSIAAGVCNVLRRGLAVDRHVRPNSIDAVLAALSAAHQRPRRAAAVVLALVAVICLATAQRYARSAACQQSALGPDAETKEGWGPAHRAQLEAAFAATGNPRAGELAARVIAVFDRHASDLRAAQTQVCLAHAHSEASTALTDQQSLCLAQQRYELAALAELLMAPDASDLDETLTAAMRLPSPAACLHSPSLLAMTPPPRDPASRTILDRIEQTLGTAEAARSARRWPACVSAAQTSIAAAHALGYPPLLAQAQLVLGRCIEYTESLSRAEASLHDAALAAQRGGDLRTLVLAWTRLLFLAGYERRQFAEGELWGRYARAVLDRLGSDDELEFGWALNLGLVHGRSGAKDGEELLVRAQKAAERHFGYGSLEAQLAAAGLANLYLDAGDAERALPLHRALLASERAHRGSLGRGSITTLANLTLDLLLLEKPLEALTTAEELMALSRAQPGNWDNHWAQQTYASALRESGRSAQALVEDRAAAATCKKFLGDDWDCAFALAGEGLDLLALHRPSDALLPLEAAYKLRQNDEAPDPEMTLGLSHALWEGGGDRQRARELARAAFKVQRETAAKAPSPANRKRLATIDAWLSQIGA